MKFSGRQLIAYLLLAASASGAAGLVSDSTCETVQLGGSTWHEIFACRANDSGFASSAFSTAVLLCVAIAATGYVGLSMYLLRRQREPVAEMTTTQAPSPCPDCAELVEKGVTTCPYCGYQFEPSTPVAGATSQDALQPAATPTEPSVEAWLAARFQGIGPKPSWALHVIALVCVLLLTASSIQSAQSREDQVLRSRLTTVCVTDEAGTSYGCGTYPAIQFTMCGSKRFVDIYVDDEDGELNLDAPIAADKDETWMGVADAHCTSSDHPYSFDVTGTTDLAAGRRSMTLFWADTPNADDWDIDDLYMSIS